MTIKQTHFWTPVPLSLLLSGIAVSDLRSVQRGCYVARYFSTGYKRSPFFSASLFYRKLFIDMTREKRASARRERKRDSDPLPPYQEEEVSGPSTTAQPDTTGDHGVTTSGPTAASPFQFPTDVPAPPYAESHRSVIKPIAIPQLSPEPTAPFLQAYAPSLLAYGITRESWVSLLDTLSAFLAAKVTDQALAHAADIGREVGKVPKFFGKNVATHVKSLGRHITNDAKRGNVIGAAMGVIGGAITLPLATAGGIVGAVASIPGRSISAASQRPRTPRERAVAYTVVANKKWLGERNLYAQLMDTHELARLLDVSSNQILQGSLSDKSADADTQLRLLRTHFSELTIETGDGLSLGETTLWLVVMEGAPGE